MEKAMLGKRRALTLLLASMLFILFLLGIVLINDFDKAEIVGTYGRDFENAVVTRVIKDNLAEDGQRYGSQEIEIEITKVDHEG